jgi:glycosyltransferase involved in cell wall biosynthesis
VKLHDWELVVVDNASTKRLADTLDLSWHPHARHIREEELGLTPARLRGISETSGDRIVFIDDDNVLAADFLEYVATIASQFEFLGVFGSGTLEPEFEVPPPPELVSRLSLLALRTVNAPLWSNNTKDYACTPWGAGLVVSRVIASAYRQLLEQVAIRGVIGRRGHRLFCGEDDLFSWAASAAGLGFGIFPQLRITHLISATRLNRGYFLRLIHDHAFSHGVLTYLLGGTPKHTDIGRLARTLLHGVRNGTFSMRCKWAASQGESAAARLVFEHGLPRINPLQFTPGSITLRQQTNNLLPSR